MENTDESELRVAANSALDEFATMSAAPESALTRLGDRRGSRGCASLICRSNMRFSSSSRILIPRCASLSPLLVLSPARAPAGEGVLQPVRRIPAWSSDHPRRIGGGDSGWERIERDLGRGNVGGSSVSSILSSFFQLNDLRIHLGDGRRTGRSRAMVAIPSCEHL